jgi:hypothetical protein
MQWIVIFAFIASLCTGCLQTGYSQPTYVISDGVQEEELPVVEESDAGLR